MLKNLNLILKNIFIDINAQLIIGDLCIRFFKRQREIREPFFWSSARISNAMLQWKIVDNNISLDGVLKRGEFDTFFSWKKREKKNKKLKTSSLSNVLL